MALIVLRKYLLHNSFNIWWSLCSSVGTRVRLKVIRSNLSSSGLKIIIIKRCYLTTSTRYFYPELKLTHSNNWFRYGVDSQSVESVACACVLFLPLSLKIYLIRHPLPSIFFNLLNWCYRRDESFGNGKADSTRYSYLSMTNTLSNFYI